MSIDKETLLCVLSDLRDCPDELIAIILRQAEQIERLEASVLRLEQRINELEKTGLCSVTPLRIEEGKRTQGPKRPVRPGGHTGRYRQETLLRKPYRTGRCSL